MPTRHTISTTHRGSNGKQLTTKQIQHEDGRIAEFSGPPGGPYEYDGDEDPPKWSIEALYEHVDEGEIAHNRPTDGGEGE